MGGNEIKLAVVTREKVFPSRGLTIQRTLRPSPLPPYSTQPSTAAGAAVHIPPPPEAVNSTITTASCAARSPQSLQATTHRWVYSIKNGASNHSLLEHQLIFCWYLSQDFEITLVKLHK